MTDFIAVYHDNHKAFMFAIECIDGAEITSERVILNNGKHTSDPHKIVCGGCGLGRHEGGWQTMEYFRKIM